jgi:hypothetical protein
MKDTDTDTLEERLALMSDAEKAHFKQVILELVKCYGPGPEHALILFNGSDTLGGVVTLNCDAMEAAQMLLQANDFFGFLNTIDAPPKEAFN